MQIKETHSFDDYLLVPQYSEVFSRKDIDLTCCLGSKMPRMGLPVISSPMDTVTESSMAKEMSRLGALAVIHRYNSIKEQVSLVAACGSAPGVGAAIGVTGDYVDRAIALVNNGVSFLCIDVAHGHHALMRHALSVLRKTIGNDIHIMAGNVATLEGFNDLADWGADSIRVGIGGGSICSTRIKTGHGVPTLHSVFECSKSDRDAMIIADGGIRNSGDIVKAYAAGADFVMLGSVLAGTDETPGEVKYMDNKEYKVYRGMASKDAQIDWRGHAASLEGVTSFVPTKGPVENVLREIDAGIRSGLSYSGAKSILELQLNAQFIIQTHAASIESSTHIKLL